ncbi:SOS response-associated peptidase [filamentous cyanobacterium LEGE 11480]|uniref:Abasic site processing protein n=1 Tax=Romeriopsis navalis LEGE 11480 TaxID=2777977 RepID=A0A928Z0L1_9CYAN|nr:SOS response-associated peptidase [Romeriopsis navalis]MBE9028381.1 SOS response-associated peptidase [Romeriopsis navalis LEGE 11480]
MCGRFTQTHTAEAIAQVFGLKHVRPVPVSYNIAPSQPVPIILDDRDTGVRDMQPMSWGLIPRWAKDPASVRPMINARAETLMEKPSFRQAYRYRRCVIPADGFYEWQGRGKAKQPYYFQVLDQPMGQPGLFALAGLWEQWHGANGEIIQSCAIVTTAPNALVQPIHDRMPVIIPFADCDRWLDPQESNPLDLFQSLPVELMHAYPVSPLVNRPSYDSAECIQPLRDGIAYP